MKDIDFNSRTIRSPADGHQAAEYYQWYRDNNQMRRNTYRHETTQGKVYACALGAAFAAHTSSQCNADIAPRWLTDATPSFFDGLPTRHLAWSDAVYGKGGLVDRAANLSSADREKMWEALLKEVTARIRCAKTDGTLGQYAKDKHASDSVLFTVALHAKMSMTAWTVVEVGEQLLTEAGV